MKKQHTNTTSKFLMGSLFTLLIAGCGGAALQVANGIGGTGVTMGRITAFGSIYVNGVKYNTDSASFTRDGVSSKQQSDFSTGEIVRVVGQINADKVTGTASEIIFSDILEGSVSKLPTGKIIEVLGQTVISNALTIFHGFDKLSDLKLGNVLEVSGFIIGDGNITASSIKLVETAFIEGAVLNLEGTISALDRDAKTFVINNNLTIDYSVSHFSNIEEALLSNGLEVYVFAEQDINGDILVASDIEKIDDGVSAGIDYEIEGYITRYVSPTDFDVDGLAVSTDSQTLYKVGTAKDLALDMRVLIQGVTNEQDVILVDEISIYNDLDDTLIEARIESIDYNAKTLMVEGAVVSITPFTLLSDDTTEAFKSLLLTEFNAGDAIFISFYSNGDGENIATRLSKIDPLDLLVGNNN